MKSGIELMANERKRQIEYEGFDNTHDDVHDEDELIRVATCYVLNAIYPEGFKEHLTRLWPITWTLKWWKPTSRVRDLVKAGSMIAAEIDRLQREEH